MWAEISEKVSKFESLVLTGLDQDGFPFSLRCRPQADPVRQRFLLDVPAGIPIQQGRASLLGHSHNEQMWNLKSFLVRGRLEEKDGVWALYPEGYFSGDAASPGEMFKKLRQARGTSKRYLEQRGLSRPKIPWDEIRRLWAEAKEG
jgi:hypothetical protein